jgi:hypothetical protein
MTGEDETEELRVDQVERAREERARARDADQSAEERAHARRAERAEYLKQKLDERAESEERVDREA